MELFFVVWSLFISQVTHARPYKVLQEARSDIQFPDYSNLEKLNLVTTSENIFYGFNSNQYVKESHFQNSQAVKELFNSISNPTKLSTETILKTLSKIYRMQFDDHLNFGFPTPYQCYVAEHMLEFLELGDGRRVVSNIIFNFELPDPGEESRIKALLSRVEVGDELLSVDGLSITELALRAQDEMKFPKTYFRMTNFLRSLRYAYTGYELLPEENESQFTFQSSSGQTYSITVPWLVREVSGCLNSVENFENQMPANQDDLGAAPDYQLHANTAEPLSVDFVEPYDSNLGYGWGYYEVDGDKYAYFKLGTFSPGAKISDQKITDSRIYLHQFRKIWAKLNNDPQIKGLVFDVRGNRGGSLLLASDMVKSFTQNAVEPLKYRLKSSDTVLNMYRVGVNQNGQDYLTSQLALLEESVPNSQTYTPNFHLYDQSVEHANRLDTVFFKPVVLMTDERCYSACDYFATLMKESQAALVIGEHFGTGGGGANVWTHSFLSSSFTPLSAYGLTDLPHSQVIRFPIRSFLHLDGINPVEDEGSAPDLILPKTLADVINDSEVQLKRISTLIDGMYNEPYPTAEVEPSNTYLAVDHPQSISWMKSNFHEFGLTGSLHEISDDYVRVGVAEFYDKALDKNFVVALDIPSGSKLQRRVSFEVDTEIQSGSDYIYVYLKTDKGTEQLTKITGTFDDRVTLNLPENKSEVHIWVTSDFDATPGHIVFRDLKIE